MNPGGLSTHFYTSRAFALTPWSLPEGSPEKNAAIKRRSQVFMDCSQADHDRSEVHFLENAWRRRFLLPVWAQQERKGSRLAVMSGHILNLDRQIKRHKGQAFETLVLR